MPSDPYRQISMLIISTDHYYYQQRRSSHLRNFTQKFTSVHVYASTASERIILAFPFDRRQIWAALLPLHLHAYPLIRGRYGRVSSSRSLPTLPCFILYQYQNLRIAMCQLV